MWIEFNNNPVGRSVGDCTVRAVSVALDVDWETAYAMLANAGFLMGDVMTANSVIAAVLREHGFYKKAIPDSCPDCYDFGDFARDNPDGIFVLGTGSHVAAIVDGTLYDSWNSSFEIPIYYWYRKDG